MKNFKSQLRSLVTGMAIAATGGVVFVAQAGTALKQTIYSPSTGLAITNPMALTNGSFNFNVADTVQSVDLYILSPTGHMVVLKGVKPSSDASINVDDKRLDTTLVIPFSATDQTGDNTETDTLFVLPGAVQPNVAVQVATVDATETVLFGTLSSDSGDADGFGVGVSVATAGYIKATNVNGGVTLGALLYVQDSANAGDDFPEQNVSMIGKKVTYTLSAGSDTAQGFIVLPVQLPTTIL